MKYPIAASCGVYDPGTATGEHLGGGHTVWLVKISVLYITLAYCAGGTSNWGGGAPPPRFGIKR